MGFFGNKYKSAFTFKTLETYKRYLELKEVGKIPPLIFHINHKQFFCEITSID